MFAREIKEDARLYNQLQGRPHSDTLLSLLALCFRSRNFRYLLVHRLLQRVKRQSVARPQNYALQFASSMLLHINFLAKALAKTELRIGTVFGAGVFLSDLGGIAVGAIRVGAGSIIHHRVTIGVDVITKAIPDIGENVWIGPDCVVFGGVCIGDGATILPGTVVSASLPAGVVASGIPCKIIRRDFDNKALRSDLNFAIDKTNYSAQTSA